MFKRLKFLTQQHSVAIYLEKSIFPVLICPVHQSTPSFHKLTAALRSHPYNEKPFSLWSYHNQTQQGPNRSPGNQEDPSTNPSSIDASSNEPPPQSQPQPPKNMSANEYKLYLQKDGSLAERKDQENSSDICLAILSKPIQNRKVVGVQTRWEYLTERAIKFLIFSYGINIFFLCFVISRPENKEKNLDELKAIQRCW